MIKSAQEFVRLRSSEDPAEYQRAAHDGAPEQVWTEVIRDYPEMKVWVAHNKKVPLEILRVLSDDLDPNVRKAVAAKRKLDQDLFEKLSSDKDEAVRQRIAYNRKTPRSIIERLADDPCPLVQEPAQSRLAETSESK